MYTHTWRHPQVFLCMHRKGCGEFGRRVEFLAFELVVMGCACGLWLSLWQWPTIKAVAVCVGYGYCYWLFDLPKVRDFAANFVGQLCEKRIDHIALWLFFVDQVIFKRRSMYFMESVQ